MNALQDRAFPGLAVALDPERMRDVLASSRLGGQDGLTVEDVRIAQVQYRPHKRCAVLYAVKLRWPNGGRSITQLLAAELTAHGTPPPAVPDDLVARYRQSGHRPLPDPVVHLPALPLAANAFPFDPALPGLVDACDEHGMRARFERIWRDRNVRVRRIDVRCLGYTPGARAALLYEIEAESRATGLPEVRRVVGKLDAQRDAAEVFARNWAVWRQARWRLCMAPPVGFLAEPNVFLQEHVGGIRLADLAGTGDFLGPVRQTARAAAALHGLALPLRFQDAFSPSVRTVRRWADVLLAIRPHEHDRIRALRDRLIAELQARAVLTGPIHGDLHPSNLLVDDGRLTLIDLDNMVLGDRLLDVGRFAAALRTSSLRVHGTPDGLEAAGEEFLAHYLQRSGEDERRARLFEAVALLVSAGTAFRLQRGAWAETACWFLDQCERVLALSLASGVPAAGADQAARRRRDKAADAARGVDLGAWSRDAQYLRGLLDPHVRRVFGAEVAACRAEPRASKAHGHLRLHVAGWCKGARWRTVLDGYTWEGGSTHHRAERLQAAFAALAAAPAGPLLPTPVAYLPELELLLVATPVGRALSALLDAPPAAGTGPDAAALDALGRAGSALAVLHACPLAFDAARAARATREELRQVRELAAELAASGPAGQDAAAILDRVTPLVAADLERTVPTVKHFSPRRILLAGARIAIEVAEDVGGTHPLLDAAEFLAQLVLLRRGNGDATALAERFRSGYLRGRPGDAGPLSAFEAVALLRLAGHQWRRDRDAGCAGGLLAAAERAAAAGAQEAP